MSAANEMISSESVPAGAGTSGAVARQFNATAIRVRLAHDGLEVLAPPAVVVVGLQVPFQLAVVVVRCLVHRSGGSQ
eukprot:4339503-Alexandrium_andersonii.AAC.1